MKKYFSLLFICFVSLGVNAQSEEKAIPFPATCLSVDEVISPSETGDVLFLPKQNCTIVDYHLKVFNRFGELIFETSDKEEGWKVADENENGVYFWTVTGNLETAPTTLESKGSVTLSR